MTQPMLNALAAIGAASVICSTLVACYALWCNHREAKRHRCEIRRHTIHRPMSIYEARARRGERRWWR